MTFRCGECEKDFETDCPYGSNVTCPNCGTIWETDYDESWDPATGEESQYAWLARKAPLGE